MFDNFKLLVQLETPRDVSFNSLLDAVANLKDGVDAIRIVEGNGGLSGIIGALKVKQMGIEPIVHIYTRDKNRMAIFSDLITLAALGLDKVTIALGSHPTRSAVPSAKPVYDLDVSQTLQLIKGIAQGEDLTAQKMPGASSLTVGVVANVRGNPGLELMTLKKKTDLGASFIMLTPSDQTDNIQHIISNVSLPVIPTLAINGRSAAEVSDMVEGLRKCGAKGVSINVELGHEEVAKRILSSIKR